MLIKEKKDQIMKIFLILFLLNNLKLIIYQQNPSSYLQVILYGKLIYKQKMEISMNLFQIKLQKEKLYQIWIKVLLMVDIKIKRKDYLSLELMVFSIQLRVIQRINIDELRAQYKHLNYSLI